MFVRKAEGPRSRPPGLLCDVPVWSQCQEGHGEKQAWSGHPVGARPCLAMRGPEVRPTEPGWVWQRGGLRPSLGRVTGRTLRDSGRSRRPGCGGPDTGGPVSSSFLGSLLGPLALFLSLSDSGSF